jgi:hypothetical protein
MTQRKGGQTFSTINTWGLRQQQYSQNVVWSTYASPRVISNPRGPIQRRYNIMMLQYQFSSHQRMLLFMLFERQNRP